MQVQRQSHGPMRLIVECNGTVISDVAQRDMFRKYGYPAKPDIIERLQMYQEECCNSK